MTDREKQIMGIAEIMLDGEIAREQGKIDCSMFDWKDCLNLGIQRLAGATALYNAGYRKMDEVTLRLDLGDCSAEEIKQIAEAFNKAMATKQTLIAVSDERKSDKEIPQKVKHEATILADCTCPRCGNVVSKVEEWGNSKIRIITEYCPFCGQHLKGE